ncbi:MAG: hypothetical protein S4CHLAM20_03870 [Chlamydiia bacterium]|nr:hypothetical protein [Chlamydiia bacterium]
MTLINKFIIMRTKRRAERRKRGVYRGDRFFHAKHFFVCFCDSKNTHGFAKGIALCWGAGTEPLLHSAKRLMNLIFGVFWVAWECDDIAYIFHSGDILNETLESEAEPCMRRCSIPTKIDIPIIRFERKICLF